MNIEWHLQQIPYTKNLCDSYQLKIRNLQAYLKLRT